MSLAQRIMGRVRGRSVCLLSPSFYGGEEANQAMLAAALCAASITKSMQSLTGDAIECQTTNTCSMSATSRVMTVIL